MSQSPTLTTEGKVLVHGEIRNARADDFIPRGDKVRVVKESNLKVTVIRDLGN